MRSPRVALPFAVALLAALLSVSAVGVAGLPASQPAVQADDSMDPGSVRIEIQLRRNGDAAFTVSMAFALENESDREAFDDLAAAFEDGELALGADAFERASERASNATGREMQVTATERTSDIENDTGVLRVSFRWTNFAESSGATYRIGDAFNTTDGTWLPRLSADQRLVIRPPPGYAVDTAPVGSRVVQGDLVWEGPTTFEPGYLQVTFSGDTTTTATPDDRPIAALFGTFLVGIGVLVVGAYWWFVHRERPAAEPEPEDVPAAETESGTGSGTVAEETEAEGEEAKEDVDLELLSDEERVEHLLQQNGGRMKQANIVKETGWSNAKVSQLLSSMADEDRVKKLRIGRENLIALPEEDIGEFDSE